MADEQMTQSLVEGGTFGLAGTMYGQLAVDARRGRAGHGAIGPTATVPAQRAAPSPAERRHEPRRSAS